MIRRLLLLSIAALSLAAAATAGIDTPASLDATLNAAIARANIPGMVAVVLRGDTIIAEGAAGVRRKGSAEPVELGDQFQICSCTKAMTATLAAMLIDEGKLSWDTTVADLFAGTVPGINPAWKTVTLQQLLAHRAGLTDHTLTYLRAFLSTRGSLTEQRARVAAVILSRGPDYPPGSRYLYSNSDYIVAGAALERITGRSWEDLIRERIFRPLGITSGGFGPPGTAGEVDQPWGHGPVRLLWLPLPGRDGTPFDPGSSQADYPLMYGPAGTVHVSVPDWAKFVSLHLRGDPANPHREVALLKADSFAKLHEPPHGEDYGCGWFVATKPWARGPMPGDTGRVFYHMGDNGRWNCVVWVAPEIDFAVLIACNRARMWGPCDEVASKLVYEFANHRISIASP
jgi:CubicO group peptidase (beta-lactamase class C family)